MEYPGPVSVPAATVVVIGDHFLIHAQDAQIAPSTSITQIDYQFKNIPTIEMASIFVGSNARRFSSFCPGDGTQVTPCPCANNGVAAHGCDNSAATGGAILSASGTVH